ncbi:cupin domain-containing protein [Nocardioides sp. LHG3406-4]|uniref:cupin domain-containing protein n=1 Tax=Nocardioides sp. LHG3406-4 TaxID=2804575 RepID=UPI003CE9D6DA
MTDPTDDPTPVFVADLAALTPQQWVDDVGVATVHATDEIGFAVQVVPPGRQLAAHHHTDRWDHFVALRGTATLHLTTRAGSGTAHRLGRGGFLAVPPGVTHRVDNTDGSEPFAYLLAQAPYRPDDFHHDEPGDGQSGEST